MLWVPRWCRYIIATLILFSFDINGNVIRSKKAALSGGKWLRIDSWLYIARSQRLDYRLLLCKSLFVPPMWCRQKKNGRSELIVRDLLHTHYCFKCGYRFRKQCMCLRLLKMLKIWHQMIGICREKFLTMHGIYIFIKTFKSHEIL